MEATLPDLIEHFGSAGVLIAFLIYILKVVSKKYEQQQEVARKEVAANAALQQQLALERLKEFRDARIQIKADAEQMRKAYQKSFDLHEERVEARDKTIMELRATNTRDRADYNSRTHARDVEHFKWMSEITEVLHKLIAKTDSFDKVVNECPGRAQNHLNRVTIEEL